jgi:DNA-binding MarR family transcriptional regulator
VANRVSYDGAAPVSTPVDTSDSVDRVLAQWAQVRPDLDVSPMGVLGRLSRLTRVLERRLQIVFARHGLQPGEFDVLATLRRADTQGAGMTAGALTQAAMVTSGAITNRIDRLVAKDLVTREVDPANRRAVLIRLTPRGKDVLEQALLDHVANEQALLDTLTDDQRHQLADLLRSLLHAHEASPPAPR